MNLLSRPPIPDWGLYPAKALSEQGFKSVACLFLGGAWEEPSEAEIAVAYDFLCDLYLATEREDVQRAVEYLGQCQSSSPKLALREVAEEESRKPPRGIDLDNPRALRAWQQGNRQRALEITFEARRRKEERRTMRLAERRAVRKRQSFD